MTRVVRQTQTRTLTEQFAYLRFSKHAMGSWKLPTTSRMRQLVGACVARPPGRQPILVGPGADVDCRQLVQRADEVAPPHELVHVAQLADYERGHACHWSHVQVLFGSAYS